MEEVSGGEREAMQVTTTRGRLLQLLVGKPACRAEDAISRALAEAIR
jgi:hypothetical protein